MLANEFIVIIEVMARVRASAMRDSVEYGKGGWYPKWYAKSKIRWDNTLMCYAFDKMLDNENPKYCSICKIWLNRGQWRNHIYAERHQGLRGMLQDSNRI